MEYAEPTYTSRALSYPQDYSAHRTGSFAEHHMAPLAVGNFANASHYHLVSFSAEDDALSADRVLELPARQCSYKFELGEGQLMLVFLPNGQLDIYQVAPEWSLVASVPVIPGMQVCSEAMFVEGYGQAFVMHTANQTLYTIDLGHVDEGVVDVHTTQLGFTPFSAVVAGVPPGLGCKIGQEMDHVDEDHEAEDHDEEHDDHEDEEHEDHEDEDHEDHDHNEEDHDDHDHEDAVSGSVERSLCLSVLAAGIAMAMGV